MTRFLLPATAILALTGIAQAQTGVAPANPAVPAPTAPMVDSSPATQQVAAMPPAGGSDVQTEDAIRQRFWGGAEYLLWWVQGQRIPALATISAPGTPLSQAGVIGAPGTAVLFGNSRITDSAASGFRVNGGLWLDDCQRCGIGAEFFLLQNLSTSFSAQSPGSPILARPFVNALTGGQDSQVIAYPGLAAGSIAAHGESQLLGASAYARHILCSSCNPCGCNYRVDGILGYRYLSLDDRVSIDEQVLSTSTLPGAPPVGTTLTIADSYSARTQFHGGDIGLMASAWQGRFWLNAVGKVAIGANIRDVTLTGNNAIGVPGFPAAGFPGGLLTAGQTGRISDSVFSFVPEVRLTLGYRITSQASITVGYNLMWWYNVARAGNQIIPAVNPAALAPATGPLSSRPLSIVDSNLWAQGINLGFLFNY